MMSSQQHSLSLSDGVVKRPIWYCKLNSLRLSFCSVCLFTILSYRFYFFNILLCV